MNKRVLGVVVGLAGIAALLFGLQSTQWVVGTDYGIQTHVGLRVMELCQEVQPAAESPGEEACSRISHDDIAQSPSNRDGFETFALVSLITFVAGLSAAALLLLVVLLAVLGRFPDLPVSPSTLAILASFATLVLVAITLAIHPWKDIGWGTGYAIYLAGGGAAGCLFASVILGQLRPSVQDW
jgi:hypothetical protein